MMMVSKAVCESCQHNCIMHTYISENFKCGGLWPCDHSETMAIMRNYNINQLQEEQAQSDYVTMAKSSEENTFGITIK
jgi:hypothetical protein